MLKELYIENYKSLKNVTVQFKDGLNIIIGKNGSGKSNLLEFINTDANLKPFFVYENNFKFASDYMYIFSYRQEQKKIEVTFEVKSEYTTENDKPKHIQHVHISWKNENDSDPFLATEYTFPDQLSWINLNKILDDLFQIRDFKVNLIEFNIPSSLFWLDRPASFSVNKNNHLYYFLERALDGFSLTFLFGYFFEQKLYEEKNSIKLENEINNIKSIFIESFNIFKNEHNIDGALKLFSPIEEIRIGTNINIYKVDGKILIDNLTLEFKVNDSWIPWNYLSDGTKRLFYLITEMSCQKHGLILIEEPELGIHPHQLYKLMQFIKEQSEEKQIIISTHSPVVLDALDPDELDRITIAKIEDGGSKFYKLTDEQKSKGSEYMKEVGELSYYWLHSDLEEDD